MPARLRPAGFRSLNASLNRPPRRLLMFSAARSLAARKGSAAAFIASPTKSFRSFATTTTTTTNDTATSDTSNTSPGQHGSITHDPPTAPAPAGIAPLPHRRIICATGDHTPTFLNGLMTNKLPGWATQMQEGFRGTYTGILNPQGRVMFDAFIYPTTLVNKDGEPVRACYIEFDEALGTQPMMLLKRYKLRTKVTLEYARDRGVFCAWGPGFGEDQQQQQQQQRAKVPHLPRPGELITMPDPRIPRFGTRFVAPLTEEFKASPAWTAAPSATDWELPLALREIEALQSLPRVSSDHYHIRRFLTGLPEGPHELVLGTSMPLECNMDLMHGIDFQKGCYVGQELTIRTKHTGVVRKRVLPVRLYNLDASAVPTTLELVKEEGGFWKAHEIGRQHNRNVNGIRPASGLFSEPNVPKPADGEGEGEEPDPKEVAKEVRAHRRQNRAVGRFLNGIGNIGLALCRLDAMTDVQIPGAAEEQALLGRTYAKDEQFGFTWKKETAKDKDQEFGVGVKAFVPAWHRERMVEEQEARAEEKRRRRAAYVAGQRIAANAEFEGAGEMNRQRRREMRQKAKAAMNAVLRGQEVVESSVWDTVDETDEQRAERLQRAKEFEKALAEQGEENDDDDDDDDGPDFPFEKGITHRLNTEQRKLLARERKKWLKAKRAVEAQSPLSKSEQMERRERRRQERLARREEETRRKSMEWKRDVRIVARRRRELEGKSWLKDDEDEATR